MAEEYVILVDSQDRELGTEEKTRCHLPGGKLHRAFTALVFDDKSRLALGRRSASKMLWPGCWDGTFASHPRKGETYASSAERRMPEELGASARMDYLHKFEYHVPYKDVGSENEVCGTLVCTVGGDGGFSPAEGEIDRIRWAPAGELVQDLARSSAQYCPWMLIALYLLDRSDPAALARHQKTLAPWLEVGTRDALRIAILEHLPDSDWRLLQ